MIETNSAVPEEQPPLERTSLGAYFEEFIKVCIVAAVIILPVRFFVIQPFIVKGASMEPTFYENEYLIVDELSFRFRDPERGEVVIFRYPKTEKRFLIKRVIGLPGDRVSIHDNRITVYNKDYPNGRMLDEKEYLPSETPTGDFDVTVTPNQFFVLGDNRTVSFDSERFGPVDRSQLVGRAVFRGLPIPRAQLINLPQYPASK